jgi:hypothetical protein
MHKEEGGGCGSFTVLESAAAAECNAGHGHGRGKREESEEGEREEVMLKLAGRMSVHISNTLATH